MMRVSGSRRAREYVELTLDARRVRIAVDVNGQPSVADLDSLDPQMTDGIGQRRDEPSLPARRPRLETEERPQPKQR